MQQLIINKSKEMMGKAFSRISYQYGTIPVTSFPVKYGIYINIPICREFCSFCPFYKVRYDDELKNNYVAALIREIELSNLVANPKWVYIGGGTPNVLTTEDLSLIVNGLQKKVDIKGMGIELHPAFLDKQYIHDLAKLGFTKISMGIESLSEEITTQVNRKLVQPERIKALVGCARENKLFVNLDLIAGISGQEESNFLTDIHEILKIRPSQITIYPAMSIRGSKSGGNLTDEQLFTRIEKAWELIKTNGYSRKSPWTFTNENDEYDSSKDELVDDYVGFGAAGFSTYGGFKMVNPEMKMYLKKTENKKVLFSPKTKSTDQWRLFARMLSDLSIGYSSNFNQWINLYIFLLKSTGFSHHGFLNQKGIMLAHHISKKVVESLPFPIQNSACIENYSEYLKDN